MKLGKLFSGDGYSPMRKEWVQAALAGAGLATSLLGGFASSSAAKQAAQRQRGQEAKEDAWYNRRYNEDYVDTAAGQNLVRRAKEFAKENWRKAAGAQAVSGGTDAATQLSKDAGNKMVADTVANIAASDQMRKSHVDDLHRQAQGQFAQMDMQREMTRANSISQAAGAASNALISLGGALDQSAAKTNIGGGSNNSTTVSSTPVNDPVAPNISTNIRGGELGKMAVDATDEQILRAKNLIFG